VAQVNRFSESIAEFLPAFLPAIGELLIWEHRAKEKKEGTCILGNAILLGLIVFLQQQQSSYNSTSKIRLPFGRILAC